MTRSSTTSIHRATIGEARTSCGIELLHPVEEECEIPTLVPRRRTMGDVKIVTTTAYDCGSCARQRARAQAKADIAAAEASGAADERPPTLDPERKPAPGSVVESAIADVAAAAHVGGPC